MVSLRQQTAFHYDTDEHGNTITAEEREKLIRPFLPAPNIDGGADTRDKSPSKSSRKHRPQRVRPFIKATLHLVLYNLIQFIFSVYVRFRIAYHNVTGKISSLLYYHHRAPEYIQKDVQPLSQLPQHLSIILELDRTEKSPAGLDALINDVCELVAWSACAGIPMLSIYEQTGK